MNAPPSLPAVHRPAHDAIADLEGFSRITSLASSMLGCPYALLTLREGNYHAIRGWSGLDFSELAGCDPLFALCRPDVGPQLVGDARSDPLLCTSAVVTGAAQIRSVIALPIRSEEGGLSGMLCAMSPDRDCFRMDQVAPLTLLAELAEQGISLHLRTRTLSRTNAILQQSQKIFRQAERAANIGSWRVDLATGGLDWSDQVFRINGLEPGHVIGVEQAVALYMPEDRDMVANALEQTIAHGTPFSFETSILRRDGQLRQVRVVGERIDVDGEPNSVAGIIQDCTEEHLRNVALKRAAEHDSLTGLYNRASFERRLVSAMERVAHEPVTVALLDLDGFKEVNDTLGHLLGDRVLEGVARRLSDGLEPGVFLARWGGDEFAILFPPAMDSDEVTRLLRELVAGFNELAPIGTAQFRIGATCGIARIETAVRTEEIMRRADLALYR
ncbi:MAG: diguanylate cyclase domain-containing protein, partial [Novosphingobium sp.]